MAVIGTPRTFHKKFKFIVEIDGVASAGFQKCSELSVEVANIEYHEGGTLIPNKSPGRLKFADVTLERGATKDHDLFDWMEEVADAAAPLHVALKMSDLTRTYTLYSFGVGVMCLPGGPRLVRVHACNCAVVRHLFRILHDHTGFVHARVA